MKKYIGASVVAMIVFWLLNFLSGITLEGQGVLRAVFSASWKAPIFAIIFHIVHTIFARLLGWYDGE